jgi:predicted transcriptional regulator
MADTPELHLSRRERQIMDVIYARGSATATAVLEALLDPPSRTAVRTLLRILEAKGHLRHRREGREFVYTSTRSRDSAALSALRRVVGTFFDGSLEKVVAMHLSDPAATISPNELKRLSDLIQNARKKEKGP